MNNNRSKDNHKSPLKKLWESGNVQKSSRIAYDVSWNILLFFLIVGLIGTIFAGGVGAGYFASLVKNEPIRSQASMKKDIYNYEETTEIYFSKDKYLGKIRSDLYREETSLENVSEHVKYAIKATEDEYFDTHNGVVPKAILRAIFQEVTNASVKTGGSTLTQQLIKNQILTNEVSFERKAKEILLALRLEDFFDKDEILEAYLNVVPFGRNASGRNIAGIETAANGIFDISADELNLPQAAFIAGLPQSPYLYTPFKNNGVVKSKEGLEPGLERMKTVLKRMYDTGYISEQEYEESKDYNIIADLAEPKASPSQEYPWLTTEIEKRAKRILSKTLAENDGYTKEDLNNNASLKEQYMILADRHLRRDGYQIHTTIDKEIFDKMQEIKNNYEQYGPDKSETVIDPNTGKEINVMQPIEVGGMLIENRTGRIISFIGGRDYSREQLNHATSAERSNGSTMKPLLVYAPAIELGAVQPGSVVADVKYEIQAGTKKWSPGNYTGRYHGITSIRYALAKSYNVPAAKTYASIIDHNPVSYLEKMGFTTLTEGDKHHLAMALGAVTNGVTIEENTNAYATFGNMGKFVDSYMIEKIVNNEGKAIFEHQGEVVDVFTPQTSYLTVDMMRDVLDYGTATYTKYNLKYKNVDWAGKTGTSQDWHDTWFVATNPNVTFGMWMGYDTPKSIKCYSCNLGYSNRNVNLWAEIVNATSDIRPELMVPEQDFQRPGGLVRSSYCASSGLVPSELCRELGLVKSDIYTAKYAPTEKDNSLIQSNYVLIGENIYVVGENTPEEFTNEGILFNPEFMKEKGWDEIEDYEKLIPSNDKWEGIMIPTVEPLENDGNPPVPPKTVQISEGILSWPPSTSSDVVGYRVYRAEYPGEPFELVGSSADIELGLTRDSGVYIVKAIDYFGQISIASPTAVYGDVTPDDETDGDDSNNDGDSNDGSDSNDDSSDGNDSTDDSDSNDSSDGSTGVSGEDQTDGGTDSSDGTKDDSDGSTDDSTSDEEVDSSELPAIPDPLIDSTN